MKVKSVYIEGMRSVSRKSYSFDSSATYLYGPNGSGKSTVLNAIQLALLGYIPGTAKSNAAVMAHANGPELRVSVKLESDDGSTATVTRTFKKKGSGASSSVSVDPEDFDVEKALGSSKLPVLDWSEFTALTGNKLKDWFIQFMPGMNEKVDWKSELEEACWDSPVSRRMTEDYSKRFACLEADSAVDQVAAANKELKADLSYAKASLAEKEHAINGLLDKSDFSFTEEQLKKKIATMRDVELKARLDFEKANKEWAEAKSKRASQLSAVQSYSTMSNDLLSEEKVSDLAKQAESLKSKISELKDEVNKPLEEHSKLVTRKEALEEEVSSLKFKVNSVKSTVESSGVCPYTESECSVMLATKAKRIKELESLSKKLASARNNLADVSEQYSSTYLEAMKLEDEISHLNSKLNLVELKLSSNAKTKSCLESLDVPTKDEIVTEEEVQRLEQVASEARTNQIEAQAQAEKLTSKLSSVEFVSKLTGEKLKLQEQIDVLNSWVKLTGANGLQTTLSRGGFSKLESDVSEEVSKVFSDGSVCKFNVSNKANSFSFGVERNGKYIPYGLLSTGEKTLYAYALMTYIAKSSDSDVKLVMMDDFFDHLDKGNLERLMNAVSENSDVQLIMAGVADVSSSSVKVENV